MMPVKRYPCSSGPLAGKGWTLQPTEIAYSSHCPSLLYNALRQRVCNILQIVWDNGRFFRAACRTKLSRLCHVDHSREMDGGETTWIFKPVLRFSYAPSMSSAQIPTRAKVAEGSCPPSLASDWGAPITIACLNRSRFGATAPFDVQDSKRRACQNYQAGAALVRHSLR